MIHLLHPRFVDEFEHDAKTQAKFHQRAAYFWLFTMIAAPFAFPPHDRTSLVQLLILEVSLYANFATEFGALSGAQASMKADITVSGHAHANIFVDEAAGISDETFEKIAKITGDKNTHGVE